ncbi:MAG: transcription antitermination factor NusB [Vicinamibacterales bacterium]
MSGPRHEARQAALQILYFWEVGRAEPQAAIDAFFETHDPEAGETVRSFASEIVHGTVADVTELDEILEQHSRHWRIARLAVIDRLILRMGIWELRHQPDVPAAVVLNEAVELARRFSTEDAVRFVNGVLDAVRRTLAERSGA